MLVLVSARALLLVGLLVVTPTLHVRSEQILPLPYNQGLARVDGGWVLSGTRSPLADTDVLVRTDDDLKVLVEVDKAIPEPYRSQGYNHVGDGDVVDGIYYVPFESRTTTSATKSPRATTPRRSPSSTRSSFRSTRTPS